MLANARQMAELVDVFRCLGTEHTYKKGEYIIRPGEAPSGVFYIREGLVKAYDITRYGEENMLIVRKSQEIFPLIWALTGKERDVIYQALAPTIVWRLDRNVFEKEILLHSSAMAPLLDMTVEMYRLHSERILNLEYRSVRERIVSFLLTMAQRFGQTTDKGVVIAVPLRHQDIASSVNASRETTSREIAGLERRGLVSNGQGVVTLLDVKGLQAILG